MTEQERYRSYSRGWTPATKAAISVAIGSLLLLFLLIFPMYLPGVLQKVMPGSDPVLRQLQIARWSELLYAIFLVWAGLYLIALFLLKLVWTILEGVKRQKMIKTQQNRLLSQTEKTLWGGWLTCSGLLLAAFLWAVLCIILLCEGEIFQNAAKYQKDMKAYQNGAFEEYEGPLDLMRGLYALPGNSLQEAPEVFYQFGVGYRDTFYCPQAIFDGTELLQTYHVKYLPETHMVVSITGPDGKLRTMTGGKSGENDAASGGEPQQKDMEIQQHPEVYGYQLLSPGQKELFNLAYSGALKNRTNGYYYPEAPMDRLDFNEVAALFYANRTWECYRTFSLMVQSDVVEKIFISETSYSDPEIPKRNEAFREAAEHVAQQIPSEADSYEKALFIAEYLCENTLLYSEKAEQKQSDEDGQIRVLTPARSVHTGYGALVEGFGDDYAFAQAFDLTARYAGLPVLIVCGETSEGERAWNMVEVDGNWYHIDVAMMAAKAGEPDYTYFMADDLQMTADHIAMSYNDYKLPLPKADSDAENWFVKNGRSYVLAQEVIADLQKNPLVAGEQRSIRLTDAAQRKELQALLKQGELPGVSLLQSASDYEPSPILVLYIANDS